MSLERATVSFTDDEVKTLGGERIVMLCAEELLFAFGIRTGAAAPVVFACTRQGKGYAMSAEALPIHHRKAA